MRFFEKKTLFGVEIPEPIKIEESKGKRIYLFGDGSKVTDYISKGDERISEVERIWEIKGKGKIKLYFEWDTNERFDDWFIPSVLYRENRDGVGHFPRGGIDSGWEFREDRMGIPGAVFLTSDRKSAGIFTEPTANTSHTASTGVYLKEKSHILYQSVPYTEAPKRYISKGIIVNAYGTAKKTYLKSYGNLKYKRKFYIYKDQTLDFYRVFKFAFDRFGSGKREGRKEISKKDIDEQITLRKHHISEYLYYERGNVCGIKRGRNDNPIISWLYSDVIGGAFLERGVQAAYLLHRLGEKEKAKKISDFLLSGQMENGLAWVCYHLHRKKWGGAFLPFPKYLNERVSVLAIGQMGYFYLKLYGECGDPAYLKYAIKSSDFLVKNQKPDGNYGRFYDPDGRLYDDKGTASAYAAIMMLELYKVVGEKKYLESAMKSVDFFKSTALKEEDYLGGALDSDCIDKEGAGVLLKLLLRAYEMTDQKNLLEAADLAAEKVLTWTWTYDVAFDEGAPLFREGFSTTGMTSVSVAHHHLDFFGVEIALDLLKLDLYSKKDKYRFIDIPMIKCAFQLLNGFRGRKNLKLPKILGWQPEQLNQTDWDYMHPVLSGGKGIYQFIVAWTPILILGALIELKDMLDKRELTL